MSCPEPMPASAAEELCVPPFAPEPSGDLAALCGRLLRHGADALDDVQCLELLCELGEPEAAALIDAFGSLPEVIGAAAADLARVAGEAAACRIKVAQALAARLLTRGLRQREVLGSWSAVVAYLRTVATGAPREAFRVLFLDRRNRLIAAEVLGVGTVDHAPVYPREVVRRALELNASALILSHNHPSGDPNPSSADIDMTGKVVEAARALGIAIHDHVIVAGDAVTSLRTLGLM